MNMNSSGAPAWANQPGQPGVSPNAGPNSEPSFIERYGRNIVVGVSALALVGGGVAVAGNLSDSDADAPIGMDDMALTDINDDTFNEECDAPAYEGTDHNEVLGQSAFFEYDLSGTDAEIHKTLRNTLSRNLVGIAAADTIIKNTDNVVDFDSLHRNINAQLSRIADSDTARQEACEAVLAKFATEAQRVTITASQLFEVLPLYNENGTLNTDAVAFVEVDAKAMFGNEDGIKGIWTDIKYGQMVAVMTEDGRLLLVKTTGDEGQVTVDSNGEPIAPDTTGDIETGTTISDDNSGEVDEGDGGSGGEDDGSCGAGCGTGGGGTTPGTGTGPGTSGPGTSGPGTSGPGTTGPNTTGPNTTGPNTTTPRTTVPNTTNPPTTIEPKDDPVSSTTVPAPPGY